MNSIVIHCPHCDQPIEVLAINCGIFRCGIFKQTWAQLPPHASKPECDRALEQGLIFGCGRPFRVIKDAEGAVQIEKCGYI